MAIEAIWLYPAAEPWTAETLHAACAEAEAQIDVYGITCWSAPPPGRSQELAYHELEARGFAAVATPLPGQPQHATLCVPSDGERPTPAAVAAINRWRDLGAPGS